MKTKINSKNNPKTKKTKENTNYLKLYLKGILMGISDLIPGISGGTIAFITGIYERLIYSIKQITPTNYLNLLKFAFTSKTKFKNQLKELEIFFLLTLFAGIFSAILIGSHLISYLLENYFTLIIAFFVGLILASTKIIYDDIEEKSKKQGLIYSLIGIFSGAIIFFFSPSEISNPSIPYIILSGFLAIFALFLPGISGSLILLILGTYRYIIDSIKNITSEYPTLLFFGIGAIIGAYTISRVVTYLFKNYKTKTLYFLIGLVIGATAVPIREIYLNLTQINTPTILSLIFFIGLGILASELIKKLRKN